MPCIVEQCSTTQGIWVIRFHRILCFSYYAIHKLKVHGLVSQVYAVRVHAVY